MVLLYTIVLCKLINRSDYRSCTTAVKLNHKFFTIHLMIFEQYACMWLYVCKHFIADLAVHMNAM